MSKEIWYRYVDDRYGSLDEYGDFVSHRPKINRIDYVVVRHTPKGVWLTESPAWTFSSERFVLNGSRKKHAYPTKEAAWESFKIRKQRQYWILVHQRQHVAAVLRLIDEQEKGPVARCVPALD